jgi:subtilase family serine protease
VAIPVIETGASVALNIVASGAAGQRSVLIKVDGANTVQEQDESNNTFLFSFLN